MNRFKEADSFFYKALEDKIFTGASVLGAKKGEIIYHNHFGFTDECCERSVGNNTFFDLASLTKPLATLLFFQVLWQKKLVEPADKIGKFFSFWSEKSSNIMLSNLLLHDSGLPAHRHYYRSLFHYPLGLREEIRLKHISEENLLFKPGTQTLYSDLGFMVLKAVLEKVCEESMDTFLQKEVYDKLGVNLFFTENTIENKDNFCATSFSEFRKRRLKGEVNDDNAFAVGGIDGHAGLFGKCIDIHNILKEVFFSYKNSVQSFLLNSYTKEILKIRKGKRFYGFDIIEKPDSSSGSFFSDNSFGHLGYTGTSFWVDIDKGIWIILLTNRVYYGDNNQKIKFFRPRIHDILINLL